MELQKNRLLLEAIHVTPVSMLLVDYLGKDMPIIHANPAFTQLTGYTNEECIGRNCRFLQGPDTDKRAVKRIREALQNQQPVCVDILNYRKDGMTFWNALELAPIRNERHSVIAYCGFQMDITASKLAERIANQKSEYKANTIRQLVLSHTSEIEEHLLAIEGSLQALHDRCRKSPAAANALDQIAQRRQHIQTLAQHLRDLVFIA